VHYVLARPQVWCLPRSEALPFMYVLWYYVSAHPQIWCLPRSEALSFMYAFCLGSSTGLVPAKVGRCSTGSGAGHVTACRFALVRGAGQRVWAANGQGRIEGVDLRARAMRGCLKVGSMRSIRDISQCRINQKQQFSEFELALKAW